MYAKIDHTHTQYALSSHTHNYAAASHTHDDRYYTESEINTKLNGKANSSHTHPYLPLTGGDMTGPIIIKRWPDSGIFVGNDVCNWEKEGNIDIRSWFTTTFSSTQPNNPNNRVGVIIDHRNGDIYCRGKIRSYNTNVHTNFNADMLDGVHIDSIFRYKGDLTNGKFNDTLENGQYSCGTSDHNNSGNPLPSGTTWGALLNIVSDGEKHNNKDNWMWQMYFKTDSIACMLRNKTNNGPFTKWMVLCTHQTQPVAVVPGSPVVYSDGVLWAY